MFPLIFQCIITVTMFDIDISNCDRIDDVVYNWQEIVVQSPFPPRDSAAEWAYDSDGDGNEELWLAGGYTPTRVNDVWVSHDEGVTWQRGPGGPWHARNLIPSTVHNGRMFIAGGLNHGVGTYNDVWSMDGYSWRRETSNAVWAPRGAATLLSFNGKLWIMGGFNIQTGFHFDDVWSSVDGITWEFEALAPWGERAMHTSVVFDGKMWVMGGGTYGTWDDHNDVWSSPDGVNWTLETFAPWGPRRFACAVVHNNAIWMMSGWHEPSEVNPNMNDVWRSSDGVNWEEVITDDIWSVRHEPSCVEANDNLYLYAGLDRLPPFNDVWKLTQ